MANVTIPQYQVYFKGQIHDWIHCKAIVLSVNIVTQKYGWSALLANWAATTDLAYTFVLGILIVSCMIKSNKILNVTHKSTLRGHLMHRVTSVQTMTIINISGYFNFWLQICFFGLVLGLIYIWQWSVIVCWRKLLYNLWRFV